MFNTILAATDGSPHANAAVAAAATLAARLDAKLVLLHVTRLGRTVEMNDELREFARLEHMEMTDSAIVRNLTESLVAGARDRAAAAGARKIETEICAGDPAGTIIDAAKRHKADLIVLGRRGLGDVRGLLLGSMSHKVAQLATCACLTVM